MSFDLTFPVAYDEDQKRRFHAEVRRRLAALAKALGLKPGSYDLRSNPGGIAVSGEITLHHERLYLQVSQSTLGAEHGILFRTCAGRNDFRGGVNQFAALSCLDDLRGLAERIWALALHTTVTCSVPGCEEEAWRWFEYEGVPDDTFRLCDEHWEILSPEDDVVRVLTPAGVPVERELAVYACADDCPICWD
jgi:hypothetical protein